MSSGAEEESNPVYVFKAPTGGNPPPSQNDETGAMVGAACACVIIVAVLFFLWKLLKRKQNQMLQAQADVEEALKSPPISPQTNTKKNQQESNKQFSEQPHLPHSTMIAEEEKEFDSLDDKKELENLIIPPLSPIPRSALSLKEEITSGDTGYNSELCRTENVLRRRKIKTDELYMEHPRDIIDSLKHDRFLLREKFSKRREGSKKAIEMLNDCEQLLKQARKTATVKKSTSKLEVLRQLRKARDERKSHELRRMLSKRWDPSRQRQRERKETFIYMQEWFDGLHLHASLHHIAEEVFLLRSQHRSDLDRNESERETLKDALHNLRECSVDISKAKAMVHEMQRSIKSKYKKEPEKDLLQSKANDKEPTNTIEAAIPKMLVKEKPIRQRVTLPKQTNKNAITVETANSSKQIPSNNPNEGFSERCVGCYRYCCQCPHKRKAATEETKQHEFEAVAETKSDTNNKAPAATSNQKQNPLSPLLSRLLKTATNDQSACETTVKQCADQSPNKDVYTLTLKLAEVDHARDLTNVVELSEREVKKALKRVPSITSLKSILKGPNNDWTIITSSSRERIANIRFNCRGKTYVIGMQG